MSHSIQRRPKMTDNLQKKTDDSQEKADDPQKEADTPQVKADDLQKKTDKSHKMISMNIIIITGIVIIVIQIVSPFIIHHFHLFKDNFTDLFSYQMLSTGFIILTFVVTVWAALGIQNSIDRKTIDDAKNDLKILKTSISENNKTIRKTTSDLEMLSTKISNAETKQAKIAKNDFLRLLKQSKDKINQVFYASLNMKLTGTDNSLPFDKLFQIEHICKNVELMHSSFDHYDMDLISIIEEGTKIISDCKNEIKPESIGSIIQFLNYKTGILSFYKGYCYSNSKMEDIKESINCFNEAITQFNTIQLETGLIDYLNALIGEAYSKITQKMAIQSTFNDYISSNPDMVNSCGNDAIDFCGRIIDTEKSEVYYRNLGCAYERKAKLDSLFRDSDDWKNMEDVFKKALDNYREAFKCLSKDQYYNDRDAKSVYRTLLSGYDRLIRVKLNMNPYPEDKDSDKSEKSRFTDSDICINAQIKGYQDIAESVKEFLFYSEIAVDEFPREKIHYTMNCFANIWAIALLNQYSDDPVFTNALGTETEPFKKTIEKDLRSLDLICSENDLKADKYYLAIKEAKEKDFNVLFKSVELS